MERDGFQEHPWRYGLSRSQLCLVCALIVTVPACYAIATYTLE